MLPEELDLGRRQAREIGRVQPAVGALDLDREIEAFAQIDVLAAGRHLERDIGEGGEGEKEKKQDGAEEAVRVLPSTMRAKTPALPTVLRTKHILHPSLRRPLTADGVNQILRVCERVSHFKRLSPKEELEGR
ncbi:MAG: hypothetical protein BWX70_01675 [Verrucomicrobia bacterium ADurb.Bin070]|nr:MAG: hypothetical protein BWX70_01675 [Verrucomicrobia bacterium ADurb.Bin070]